MCKKKIFVIPLDHLELPITPAPKLLINEPQECENKNNIRIESQNMYHMHNFNRSDCAEWYVRESYGLI